MRTSISPRSDGPPAEQFGYQVHLLHDVHRRLTPIEAGRLGAALEPYRLFWMEDPTPAEARAPSG